MTRYKNTAPHLLNRRRSWGQGSHVFAGRLRPKTDHSGTPQSQEQRYRQNGIVNIDTAEPYDSLTMVSGDISRRAHGFIALGGKEGRLLKVEDLKAQHHDTGNLR